MNRGRPTSTKDLLPAERTLLDAPSVPTLMRQFSR